MTATGLSVLLDCLDLESVELDLFRSRTAREPGHRLFGGEVAAQALVAAERTVDPVAAAHSLHAYFLRPGESGSRVVYQVDRLHEGRTFRRRRVTAIQAGEPILCLEASFTLDGSSSHLQAAAPEAPRPETCPPVAWTFGGGGPQPGDAFDLRVLAPASPTRKRGVHDLWARPRGGHTGGRVSAAAVLTYLSDLSLAGVLLRPGGRSNVRGMTSLDHVLWFHNEVRLDDWWLYAKTAPAVGDIRGLAQGRIFHRDGTLMATVAQEGLIHGGH